MTGDNKGRVINFKNTIILMTTNSKDIDHDFKPEVLGRLDARLTYKPLDSSIMLELINKQVKLLNERLKGKKVEVKLDAGAIKTLTEQGFDAQFGARPLNAVFNKLVNRPLSKLILSDTLKEGVKTLSWNGNEMIVT